MRTTFVAILVMLAASACADTIRLKNGKTYQGKVIRDGDKVFIETDMATFPVDPSDILYTVATPATSQPAQPESPASPLAGNEPEVFTTDRATCPETMIFFFMRKTTGLNEARDEIAKYQTMSHDRKRKISGEWLGPAEFKVHRQAFLGYLKEAQAELRKSGASGSGAGSSIFSTNTNRNSAVNRQTRNDIQKQHARSAANVKIVQASQAWLDPLLRDYLIALADLSTKGNVSRAQGMLSGCCRAAPRVAGFHQACGMAMQEADRPLDALAEFLAALQLAPDSRDAIQQLRTAIQNVPGSEIRKPVYLQAQKVADAYEEDKKTSNASANLSLLMPGKAWTLTPASGLPTPPYDRLTFRQAVAIPIGPNTLLVDASLLENALDLQVQIDAKTTVPAKVRKVTSSGKSKLPPLATITVSGYEFTPVGGDKSTAPAADQAATLYGVNFYTEMGSTLREIPAKVASATAGQLKLSAGLAPGEAAGPILTAQGTLLGFAAARTDPQVENGGPDAVIPLSQILPLMEQVRKSGASKYGLANPYGGGSTVKRTVTTQPAPGKVFVVHAVLGETLSSDK